MSTDHKKKIAVFDLDGTLLKGDSLRALALQQIPTCPSIIYAVIKRKFLNKSRAEMAENLHHAMKKVFTCPEKLNKIVNRLADKISLERFAVVQNWERQGAKTVLLSASPHDYVSPLAKRISMNYGFGSQWSNNFYNHLFASAKLAFLESRFPKNNWEWAFAMSDSTSDNNLLKKFKEFRLVKPL